MFSFFPGMYAFGNYGITGRICGKPIILFVKPTGGFSVPHGKILKMGMSFGGRYCMFIKFSGQ